MSSLIDPPPSGPSGRLSISELIAFFSPSAGEEKARETVHATLVKHHLVGKMMLDRHEALGVLDSLALEDGIMGVAARFAKARILLRRF
ncbi:MAG: hypothetical protein ABI551_17295 [Polyangiaceae bacterium]